LPLAIGFVVFAAFVTCLVYVRRRRMRSYASRGQPVSLQTIPLAGETSSSQMIKWADAANTDKMKLYYLEAKQSDSEWIVEGL